MGKIDIINRALTKLGEARINSIDDDVKAAGVANSLYENVRDAEMAGHRWGFAVRRAALPAEKDAPAFGWEYSYLLPHDLLRVLEAGGWPEPVTADYIGGSTQAYALENGRALCDSAPPLHLIYIARVEDSAMYPAVFAEALAARLAVEMAEALTGSNSKRELAWKEYEMVMKKARQWGAVQQPPQSVQDDTWITARLQGGM